MTNQERYSYFESGVLQRTTAVELLDWAGYWTTTGLGEITDPLQKLQTRSAIRMILTNLAATNKLVAHLAISYDEIKNAEFGEVTDEIIHTVVVSIMATKLEWITGINQVPDTSE